MSPYYILVAVVLIFGLILIPALNEFSNLRERIARNETDIHNLRNQSREYREQLNYLWELVKEKL